MIETYKVKIERKQKVTVIALVLMLAFTVLSVTITSVNAARSISFVWMKSHEIIGANQPIIFGLDPLTRGYASVYGVTWGQLPATEEYIWPDAYVTFTRPDGTTDSVQGPFKLGVQQRPRFEYSPNMAGTWRALFVFPGDQYYNPFTVAWNFEVQQQPVPKRDVWAYLSLKPNDVIGINQWLLVNAWVTPHPLCGSEIYEGYNFVFSRPDGTTYEVGPLNSEGSGTVWFELPLDQVGEWSVTFSFPGNIHNIPASITQTILVQEDPVTIGYPDTPLPSEEWTFPINVMNREWRNIAGPWYMTNYNSSKGAWNPYTEAPRSSHILWKIPPLAGVGGFIGSPHSIQTGGGEAVYAGGDTGIYSSSSARITTIMAGRGYYTAGGMIYCVDIRTGENLWSVPGSFNVGATRSATPVLYQFGGNKFTIYDGLTGDVTLSVEGMPMAANLFEDPFVYSVQDATRFGIGQEIGTVPGTEVPIPTPRLIKWTTEGTTTTFANRIVWNISMPINNLNDGWLVLQDGLVVSADWYSQAIPVYLLSAINATTGEFLYSKSIYDVGDPDTWVYKQGPMIGSGYGKIYWAALPHENEGRGFTAYDVASGQLAWVSEAADYPWGTFWAYMPESCGYGMIYGLSYGGVYAFDAETGEIVWHYIAEDPYHETSYNMYPYGSIGPVVGGGLVFAPNTEHSPTFYYRGLQLHAIDVYTGEKVWSIKGGQYRPTALAYGILVAEEAPSGYTYAFGKGSTETTVSTSSKVADLGSSILIEGTVMDQSPSQKGTPAIGDEHMSPWMEYLHMQQPCPGNAEGVEVVITTLDPNGNTYELARTTSSLSGTYGSLITPPVPGLYKIIATFEGSESYYGSYAETYLVVEDAPSPSATVEPELTAPTTAETTSTAEPAQPAAAFTPTEPTSAEPIQTAEAPLITTEVAIIAAVTVATIIGIVNFWALRKRK